MSNTFQSLAQQAQTYPVVILFDIVSVEDGAVLHIASLPCYVNGNTYATAVLAVSGFDIKLEDSPLGVLAIPDIQITLGDASGMYTAWDNAHYFKGAKLIATLVMIDPSTRPGTQASSDTQVVFQGICNAPDESSPLTLKISAFNRFNTQFLMLPSDRISEYSQTIFPNDGGLDSDTQTPTDPNTFAYRMNNAGGTIEPSYISYQGCGYGPARGNYSFGGENQLGNYLLDETSVTGAGNSGSDGGLSGPYLTASGLSGGTLAGGVLAIVAGTGNGQVRAITNNTTGFIFIANPWTTVPDSSSAFVVFYGTCSKTQSDCTLRGMYSTDENSNPTGRFRGITTVTADYTFEQPSGNHTFTASDQNAAKYNDVIPMVYGTAEVNLKILFTQTANDVRGEAIVCMGPVQSITNLLIGSNPPELIPYVDPSGWVLGDTTTGLWTYWNGALGASFSDVNFPGGNPYSLIAAVYFKFPPEFVNNAGDSFAITATVAGCALQTYDFNGNPLGEPIYTNNAAWVVLDVLQRAGWPLTEINMRSFFDYSVYASQQIEAFISSDSTTPSPRFQVNDVIDQQRPLSDILSSILGGCQGILSYDNAGLLRLDVENRVPDFYTLNGTSNCQLLTGIGAGSEISVQLTDGAGVVTGTVLDIDTGTAAAETITVQSIALGPNNLIQITATFANAHSAAANVWSNPANYFYFDMSSVTRASDDSPNLTRSSLKTSETANDILVEFQNSLSEYTQDTAEILDTWEATQFGAKVQDQINAEGFWGVDPATRALQLVLYKKQGRRDAANKIISRGNLLCTLTSSVKSFNTARVGAVCFVTYLKESWTKKAFRVVAVTPGVDEQFPYWQITYTLREHDDGWYDDINGTIADVSGGGGGGSPSGFIQGWTTPGPDGTTIVGTSNNPTVAGNLIFFTVTGQNENQELTVDTITSSTGVTYYPIVSTARWDALTRTTDIYWGIAKGGVETITITYNESFVNGGIDAGEWANDNPDPWTGAYNWTQASTESSASGGITPPGGSVRIGVYMSAEYAGVTLLDGSTARVTQAVGGISTYVLSDGIVGNQALANIGLSGSSYHFIGIFAFET